MWIFGKKKPAKPVDDPALKEEIWTPVPGYEKYYRQNSNGDVKSTGCEFDFSIECGCSEEKAALYTMHYIKGYLGHDHPMANNVNKVLEVMKKKTIPGYDMDEGAKILDKLLKHLDNI